MLEIESLAVATGGFRLSDVDLRMTRGECHAVLGPSGSGKSTLLNAILGLLPLEGGSIRIAGEDVTRVPVERRGLGYVPQQIGLFPHLTVRDNLAYSARARGVPPTEFRPLVDELVAATGIGPLLNRRPATLSGGERQRVGLVRALASRPRLVLLDEPFAALHESLKRELWMLLADLRRKWQLTVLHVTHDLVEAFFLADRVTVLWDGRVAQQGEKTEVYARPATIEAARFLGVETLQSGRIVGVSHGMATVQVGTAFLAAPASRDFAEAVIVSIRGEDVALEREGEATGSDRNRFPARVVSLQPLRQLVWVELDAGFPLRALVTRSLCEEMALQSGSQVMAVIQASAVHLIGNPE